MPPLTPDTPLGFARETRINEACAGGFDPGFQNAAG